MEFLQDTGFVIAKPAGTLVKLILALANLFLRECLLMRFAYRFPELLNMYLGLAIVHLRTSDNDRYF